MTDYEDLTFLDPDSVPSSTLDLASIKSRGRRQTVTRRIAATVPAVLAVAAIAIAVAVIPGAHGGGSARIAPATQSPSASATASPTGSAGSGSDVTNLQVPNGVPGQLLAAYVSFRDLPAGQITAFAPDALYYAHVRGTDTDWALGTVVAAPGASSQTLVNLQDGANQAVFHRTGNGPWQVALVGIPAICPGLVPDSVLLAWDMHVNTTGCAGSPIALSLATAGAALPSGAYVTEEGSLLRPTATGGTAVALDVMTGEEPFILHASDYRIELVKGGFPTTPQECSLPAGSDGHVVAPLSEDTVTLSCPVPTRTAGDGSVLRFLYAPGGSALGAWTGA